MNSSDPNNKNNYKKINCLQCAYFALTWEPKHPRLCKLYGFKTNDMPSNTVYKSSGSPCDGFVPKKDLKK